MRRPYTRWCRFHTSPAAPLVKVRWFFTDLPFQTHESIINSLDWQENPHNNTLVGEQDFDDWEYNGAEHVPGLVGGHECGTISDFQSGQDWPYTGPPIKYGPDFIPACCPRDFGAAAVGGAGVDFLTVLPYPHTVTAGASAQNVGPIPFKGTAVAGAGADVADVSAVVQAGAQAVAADQPADVEAGAQSPVADQPADVTAGAGADNGAIPWGHVCTDALVLPVDVVYTVVSELSETGERWAKFPVTMGQEYYVKYVNFGNGQVIDWFEGVDCATKVLIGHWGGPTPQCSSQAALADGFVFVRITFDVITPGSGMYEWGYGQCPL
jgi:hypothetical protein